MKTQEDYINGLLETRRACDKFGQGLTPNDASAQVGINLQVGEEGDVTETSYMRQLAEYIGLVEPISL